VSTRSIRHDRSAPLFVACYLRKGNAALPPDPNGGSFLAFARTPYAIGRLLELGAAVDVKDRWETTPAEKMSRLGPRGLPLVKHLVNSGVAVPPEAYARLGDKHAIEVMLAQDPQLIKSDDLFIGAVDCCRANAFVVLELDGVQWPSVEWFA
jgi:hypothetical protein